MSEAELDGVFPGQDAVAMQQELDSCRHQQHGLHERISLLEQELQITNARIIEIGCERDDLRSRLKRLQRQNSQLKVALERCIESRTTNDGQVSEQTAMEAWAIVRSAEDSFAHIIAIAQTQPSAIVQPTTIAQPAAIAPESISVQPIRPESTEGPEVSPVSDAPEDAQIPAVARSEFLYPELPAIPHSPLQIQQQVQQQSQQQSSYQPTIVLPRAIAPKFIQDLTDAPMPQPELVPLVSGGRSKAVNSLAAVKLPQFPRLQG